DFAALRKRIHAQAQAQAALVTSNPEAGANIERLLPGRFLRAEYNDELTPYFQLLEGYSNAITSCALDYALNGEQTSLAAARRNLLAAAQWSTWTPPRF